MNPETQSDTPLTLRCYHKGGWHTDELANTSANLERALTEERKAYADALELLRQKTEECWELREQLENINLTEKLNNDSLKAALIERLVENSKAIASYAHHTSDCKSQRATTTHFHDQLSSLCNCGLRQNIIDQQALHLAQSQGYGKTVNPPNPPPTPNPS